MLNTIIHIYMYIIYIHAYIHIYRYVYRQIPLHNIHIYRYVYRQIPLHTHDYLTNSIQNISVATNEGSSRKFALSEGGSRGNIES